MRNQFNADEETVGPPELTIGGRVHKGRVLSIVEWFAFKKQLDALPDVREAKTEDELAERVAQRQTVMMAFLRAIFSAHQDTDPVAALEALGFIAIAQAFNSFFSHQQYALGLVLVLPKERPSPKTDGTDSPDKTAPAPNENDNASPTS